MISEFSDESNLWQKEKEYCRKLTETKAQRVISSREQARNKRISQCIQRINNNICQMDVKINISKNKNAEEPEQLKPINNARNKDSKSIILDTINFNSLSPNRREFIHMSPDNLHTFTTLNSRVLNATPSTKNYEEIPWENIMVKNLKQK